MNVAVLEPAASLPQEPGPTERGFAGIGAVSDWIDPEGDDWFAAIYRELAQESVSTLGRPPATELDHWFG
jgi:hypothetical protein